MARKKASTPEIQKLQKDMEHVFKTVYHGNGSPSLTNQVTKLDSKITSLTENVDDKFDNIQKEIDLKFVNVTNIVNERFEHLSQLIRDEFSDRKNNLRDNFNHRTAITTAALASITSVIVLFLSEFFKRIGG